MGRDDWYRNTKWDASVAEAFEAKLRRARDKAQYLRIQACILASTCPEVTLQLLERYFALGEHFDMALAHVDRAKAHLALGDMEAAFAAYEAALARERSFPGLLTNARTDYPYLVALLSAEQQYRSALEVICEFPELPQFPIGRFKQHAAAAMILAGTDRAESQCHAREALQAAAETHSGFRYHPKLGLVSEEHEQSLVRLRELCEA
ncbi:hypothetical protein [Lysobacter sp. HA35]